MLRSVMVLFVFSILVLALSGTVLADPRMELQPLRSSWEPPATIGQPDDDEGDDDNGIGFGKKIAGAWLGTGEWAFDFDCDGIADTPANPVTYDSQSFTASGLYIVTNPTDPNLAHGAWEKTGQREVSTNNIVYFNNVDTGVLEYVMRIPGVFTFDSEFKTATSTYTGIGYLASQNPLDPTETPLWCTIGQHFVLRKVLVTP